MENRKHQETPFSASIVSASKWYWNRLRCMSIPEIGHRVERLAIGQLQKWGALTARRVPAPNLNLHANPFVAVDICLSAERYVAAADKALTGVSTVFGAEYTCKDLPEWNRDRKTGRTAPLSFGKTLDYKNEALVGNIKYLWEPNRHLHWVVLAQAFRLTGQRKYLEGLRVQLESWLDQCPYLMGPNWTSSLELAIRLINWSIVWQFTYGSDNPLFFDRRGQALRERWLVSIYQHMHFIRGHLSRYSSANNHLIGELAGLFIGTHTWPFWRDAEKWRMYAKKHLTKESLLQNFQDGVNREQAVSYQQFVLDFMLLAAFAGHANGDDFPVQYWHRIERMLEFIGSLMDVGGNIPMIGDADDGYVVRLSQEENFSPYRSLLATGAALFNRSDFKFKAKSFDDKSAWLLGKSGMKKFSELKRADKANIRRDFPQGGYYVLGSQFDTEKEIRIVVDAGPLGYRSIAAHGHADALSFTLAIGGNEFLIDPGTYAYHTEKAWRDYFRGTGAHNTVRVDGVDQSVSGGNFLWLQHARTTCVRWDESGDLDKFAGKHDGYRRLADPVVHQRELIFDKSRQHLEVIDIAECESDHVLERCWHFAEDVEVTVSSEGTIDAVKNGCALRLQPREAVRASIYRASTTPPGGWVSRRFDEKSKSCTVIWENKIKGTTRLRTSLQCSLPLPRIVVFETDELTADNSV